MADIKVVIQLQDTIEDEINSLESPTDVSNASINKTGEQFNTLSTKSAGANLKSWAKQTYKNGEYVGSLSLADGYVGGSNTQLIEQYGYNGYVFGAVPESKQLSVALEVVGKNIDSIIVYGDKTANQFPTKAYRDGNPNDIIYSDDPVWAIKFDQQSTSHTITFLEWNRANYNACITYVAELKNELTLDKSWIKSVESLSQSTGQPKDICYGVIPSSGTLEIIDRDGEIKDYLQDGIISSSDMKMDININSNKVQSHLSIDSDYSFLDGLLNVSLGSEISKWKDTDFEGFELNTSSVSLITLLSSILVKIGTTLSIDCFETIDLYNRVSGIFIPYSYMLPSSIKDALDKVCQVAQLYISLNDKGEIKIFDARPIIKDTNIIISIPIKAQNKQPYMDIVKKNKYNKVVVPNNNVVYDYIELVQIPFSTYERPAFVDLYSPDDDKHFSRVENRQFSQFNDIHEKANENLEYIAFNVPYEGYSYFRYSLSKFSVNKGDNISDYNNFKLSFVSESLTQLIGSNSDGKTKFWLINSTSDNSTTQVFIRNNESEIINTFFNLDSNGNISTAKDVGAYALGVVKNEHTIDFYIFKLDARICSETVERDGAVVLSAGDIEQLNDYTGTIIIYNKELKVDTQSYSRGDGEKVITLEGGNELITNQGYHQGVYGDSVRATIAKNILSDYEKGISVAEVTISCLDMFDVNGNKVKDFSNGEILEVGDVVRVDKDNDGNSLWSYNDGTPMYWRVTGRNFRKVGVPMIDLELQEVRVVS